MGDHCYAMCVTHTVVVRIKEYESKIAELESETDRLSQALETQKHAAEEARVVASKKLDELTKEVQRKVCSPPISMVYWPCADLAAVRRSRPTANEVEPILGL